MLFKEMNPDDVWQQLEGHKNVITEEVKRLFDYFSTLHCQRCTGSCRPVLNKDSLFQDGGILPNYLAECNDCGTIFTPYTRIEVAGPTKDPLKED